MDCLGKDLKSIKDRMNRSIITIIESSGGKIDENGMITISNENLERAAREIRSYISEYMGDAFVDVAAFITRNPETGELKYGFPQTLETVLEQKIQFNKQQETLEKESIAEFAIHQAALEAMESQVVGDVNFDDSMTFAPALNPIDLEEFNNFYTIPEVPFDVEQNSIDVESGNANILQYVIYKKDLASKIVDHRNNFQKTNRKGTDYYNNTVKQFNQAIERLDKEIKILDSSKNNVDAIYQDVSNEIDYLSSVLDNISIESFDITELLRRLENLSQFFNNEKLSGDKVTEDYKNSNLFWVEKGHPGYKEMSTRVRDLVHKWRDKQADLVKNIMETNPVVQQNIREGKLKYTDEEGKEYTGEETLELIKKYIDNPTDTNYFISRLYGAGIGGDVFGQILKLEMDVAHKNRQGQTGPLLDAIDAVFERIKKKSDKDKNIFEEFIQKGSLGVKTNMLVSKFSENWFDYYNKRSRLIKAFFSGGQEIGAKSQNYGTMMSSIKNNEDFIDVTKLKVFRDNDKFNNAYTSRYFVHSDAEMDAYRDELIRKLGVNYYNAMVKRQTDLLSEWIETVAKDDMASAKFRFGSNPFEFVRHFYSENYSQPVDDTFLYSKYAISFPLHTTRDGKRGLNYFNQDFTKIENDPDKFEFWDLVNTLLTEYLNPELQSVGEVVKTYELPQVQDLISNEIIKNASWGKKGLYWSRNLWNNYAKMFASSSYANLDREADTKIGVGYSNTISRRAKEVGRLLKTRSVEELAEMANKEGIKYDIDAHYYSKLAAIDARIKPEKQDDEVFTKVKQNQKNAIKEQERDRLAKAIANKRTFSKTDENFINTLRGLASVTDNLSARKTSLNIANIIHDYVKTKTNSLESNKNTSLNNINNFFESFIKRNIYQDTVHGEREKDEKGELKFWGKVWSKKVTALNFNKVFQLVGIDVPAADWSKYMSTEDKRFSEFLKNEIKEIGSRDNFDFRLRGFIYTTKDGKYFEKKEGVREGSEISREKIEFLYAEYLGKRASELGVDRTIGSLFSGFMSVFVQKALMLNPKAGFRNLWEGGTKNMQIAASGRYGFGLPELQKAKDFLWGMNIDRYLDTFDGKQMLSVNWSGQDHALNMKTYKMMIQRFGLIQDRKNEFARSEDYDSKKWKFRFHAMDFAVENPEAHNQGELVVSQLQSIYIDYIDENGEKKQRPVFDGEKKDFIWKPGTMTLKDEYRTPENIRMWENFLESRGENNQHLTAILGIQALIERTQGNYSDRDIVALQGHTLGRALMTFKRFYPEHFWQNFGGQQFDLIRGETNFKGRKRLMLEHAPVTAAYLSAVGALSLTSGIGMFLGGGLLLGFIGNFAVNKFINKEKTKIQFNTQSLKLSLGFTLEMLTRSIDRPLEMLLRGKTPIGNYWLTNTVIGKTQGLNPVTMTSKERKLLSENAQEIGQRVNLVLSSVAIITALKALVILMSGDDDDELKENMKKIEGTMNLVLNTANTLNSQLDEMNNPRTFLENVSKISVFGTLDNANRVISTVNKVMKEDADPSVLYAQTLKFLPVTIPNSVVDQVFRDGSSYATDPNLYENYWWNGMKDDAGKRDEKRVRNRRAALRDEIENYYYGKFSQEFPEESRARRKAMAKDAAKKEISKQYAKEPGETGGEMLKRVDFKAEEKAWSRGEATSNYTWWDLVQYREDKMEREQKAREKYEQ